MKSRGILYRNVLLSLLVVFLATASARVVCPGWGQVTAEPGSCCCSQENGLEDSCCASGPCLCQTESPPATDLTGPTVVPLELALLTSRVALPERVGVVATPSYPDFRPYSRSLMPARRSRAPPRQV